MASSGISDSFAESHWSPYGGKPLKVKVLAVDDVINYRNAQGEEKISLNCGVSDGDVVVKLVVYDQAKFQKFRKGNTVVLRDFIKKSDDGARAIVVTKVSKVFMATPIDVGDDKEAEALRLINPPPAALVTLEEGLRSPPKKKVSIRGKDEQVKHVQIRGEEVAIRSIVLADDTIPRCRVSLWREASAAKVHPGDFVSVTDVITNIFRGETTLSTTNKSAVTIEEAPLTTDSITVVGVSVDGEKVELLLEDDSALTVDAELFLGALPAEITDPESAIEDGPLKMDISRRAGEIIEIELS